MYNAILCGDRKRMIHMAELYGSFKEYDPGDNVPYQLLGYALKYVILDEKENALKAIEKIEERQNKRGMKQYAQGHGRAFRGLVERDADEFNKGLEFMLRHHEARIKREGRTLEQYFAYDSIALAMLAKDRGMEITVKHALLPMEYLESTQIDYSEIHVGFERMANSTWTKEEYFEYCYTAAMKFLKECYASLGRRKGNPCETAQFIKVYNNYCGMLELVYKHNLAEGRRYFYKSTLASEWNYIEFPRIGRWVYTLSWKIPTSAYESMYSAILSADKTRMTRMAELFGCYTEYEVYEPTENLVDEICGYALKYVILDDKQNALKAIERMEKTKTNVKGHCRAFRGLLERDAELFNKGLTYILNHHVARMEDDFKRLEKYFCYDGVALAMLAMDRGIEIAVEHELLPKEFLESTQIDYAGKEQNYDGVSKM
jgi:hypothetical protein